MIEILFIVLLSSIRHTWVAIPVATELDYTLWEVTLYTALGGTLGTIFFIYAFKAFKRLLGLRKGNKKRRIFTKTSRFIVRIKKRFGLIGIAFITPPLLSIPVGTIIAASIYNNKLKVFFFIFAAVIFWSFIGAVIFGSLLDLV